MNHPVPPRCAAQEAPSFSAAGERPALLRYLARVQQRLSCLVAELQQQVAERDDRLLALQGQRVVQETALLLAREEIAGLRAELVHKPARQQARDERQELLRLVDLQARRIESLERERHAALWRSERAALLDAPEAAPAGAVAPATVAILSADTVAALPDEQRLAAALAAADLVLCQAGCLGHDDYWRVKEYCARSGKRCVLVEPGQALPAAADPA